MTRTPYTTGPAAIEQDHLLDTLDALGVGVEPIEHLPADARDAAGFRLTRGENAVSLLIQQRRVICEEVVRTCQLLLIEPEAFFEHAWDRATRGL